jgi:HNH endonuclease
MIEARCGYHRAIQLALTQSYTCDIEAGTVIGSKGFVLAAHRRGRQRYGTITLSISGMQNRQYAVPIHKVIAYAIWGDAAFAPGIHVRHLDGNSENNRRVNLALGTACDNERDKSSEVKSRAARAARAAQVTPHNAKFTYFEVDFIRERCSEYRRPNGRVKRGIVKDLAERFDVTPAAISAIANRKNYAN